MIQVEQVLASNLRDPLSIAEDLSKTDLTKFNDYQINNLIEEITSLLIHFESISMPINSAAIQGITNVIKVLMPREFEISVIEGEYPLIFASTRHGFQNELFEAIESGERCNVDVLVHSHSDIVYPFGAYMVTQHLI